MLDFVWVILDHPRSAIVVGRSLVCKFGVDRSYYSVGNTAILRFRRFVLELPIHVVISVAHAQNQR